jgi:hypothetical protein
MRLIINLLAFAISFMLTSCANQVSRKKLNLITLENEKIRVEKYRISEITSVHQFIDITNKRWNKVERILEANDGSIDSVFIKHDTLFIQKSSNQSLIYDLASSKFGYKIIVLNRIEKE